MRRFPDTVRKRTRIEIIPMIDVMMFLLVFFVLISLNTISALGLKAKLPISSEAKLDTPPKRLIVSISQNNEIQVDKTSFSTLEEFKKYIADLKIKNNKLAVIINGDESAKIQLLVDVMDVLKAEGVDSLTIAAKKQ